MCEENNLIEGKVCTGCKEWKLLSEYYHRNNRPNGYKAKCKKCTEESRVKKGPIIRYTELYKICPKCGEEKYLTEGYYKNKCESNGHESYCKICSLEGAKKYKNSERAEIKRKERYYSEENTQKRKEKQQRDKISGQKKLWQKTYAEKHKGRISASRARRRAAKLRARPIWYESERKAIELLHEGAKELKIKTNKEFHVDHIVPLRSKLVCGLETIANLQILEASINCSKGNRYWPDMP